VFLWHQLFITNRIWKQKMENQNIFTSKTMRGKKYTVWPVSVETPKAVFWERKNALGLYPLLKNPFKPLCLFIAGVYIHNLKKWIPTQSARGWAEQKTCVSVPSRKETRKTERRPEPSCSVCRCSLAVPLRSHSSDYLFPGCTAFPFARVPVTVNSSRGGRR
jgi:hypothetical protein